MSTATTTRVLLPVLMSAALVASTPSQRARAEDARTIEVEVVELAGKRAYITPGERAGLRRGDAVRLGKARLRVVAASADSALLETRGRRLRVGQRGRARVQRTQTQAVATREKPTPLAAFAGLWDTKSLPATGQTPTYVPLGQPSQTVGATRLQVSLGGAARIPTGGDAAPIYRSSLRARLSVEPFVEVPLAFDADLSAQLWLASDLAARPGRASRPLARVHTLTARYGHRDGLHGMLGRLRYAAAGLGALDGLRVQTPLALDGLSLSAFGGAVPDPLDGTPDPQTARFGGELAYADPTSALSPRLSLSAHGSRYRGELDERRLFAEGGVAPGAGHVGGYAQVSFFDADNPWNAPSSELTAAGAHAGVRLGALHADVRLDLQRPERSLWLAAVLPQAWLCIPRPAPPSDAPEACYGDEVRYLGQLALGLSLERVSIDLGISASRTAHADAEQNSAFASLRLLRILERVRADVSLSASDGSLFRTAALTLSPGLAASEDLDISLRYRPAIARYAADLAWFIEHAVGASVRLTARPGLSFSLDADAVQGRDVRLLLIQLLSTFRT